MPKIKMQTRITILLTLAISLLLVACAGLRGPREVELPLSKLQEAIDRKFPFDNQYLEIFALNVSNPRLTLQPDTNRVVTSMDVVIAPPFLNKAWRGSFALSGLLQIDAGRNAIILTEPRLDTFALDGLESRYASQIAKVGSLLAGQLLQDVALYTFKPDDFSYAGTRFVPTRISTKSSALVVTFEPAK